MNATQDDREFREHELEIDLSAPLCVLCVRFSVFCHRSTGGTVMGNLPHFLNAWTGLIAASIFIPSLIVLYFLKLRRREMPVSSTLLWRKAVQDLQVNAPFQRLRKNLLLFLQLLLLAALLLALARPILNYTPGAGPRTIILIDRSASMSADDMPGGRRGWKRPSGRRRIWSARWAGMARRW